VGQFGAWSLWRVLRTPQQAQLKKRVALVIGDYTATECRNGIIRSAQSASVGIFCYGGHAMQFNGVNDFRKS
jgi:hypothetical protein